MKSIGLLGILLFILLESGGIQAQTQPKVATADTTASDSADLAQQLILEHAQQQMLDSMIRMRLNEEMATLGNDSRRKAELEQQLVSMKQQDSLRRAAQMERIAALKLKSTGFAVAPFGDTLFFIYTKLGSFEARERAEVISVRMVKLYKERDFVKDSLSMLPSDNGLDIYYGADRIIMSVSTMDAMWLQTTTDSLASSYLAKIGSAITQEQKDNSLLNWGRRIGLVAMILVSVVGIIWFIGAAYKRLELYLIRHKDKYFKGINIRAIKLLGPDQQIRFSVRILRFARAATIILTVYLALPLLFSVFPDTKVYADTLIEWVLSPAKRALQSLLDFMPNLFTIVVIFLITRYGIRAIKYFAHEVEQAHITLPGFHQDWAQPTFNIVKFLLYAFMLIIIFPYLPGSDSPAFQGVTVFLGVLISFGSSSAITNIIAGLVITYMRPFKIGDRVRIGDVTGDVLEKTMLVTRILTIKNEDITVPNSTVLSSSTINYSSHALSKGLILNTTVTIGYDVPWRKMHETLIQAALRTQGIRAEPKPFVLQTSLDDYYVSYQINAYTSEASRQAALYSELHQHIQDCCNEAGIEILSPHYRALRDGNMVTIPTDYLPADYVAPPFVVQSNPPQTKDDQG